MITTIVIIIMMVTLIRMFTITILISASYDYYYGCYYYACYHDYCYSTAIIMVTILILVTLRLSIMITVIATVNPKNHYYAYMTV